MITRTFKVPESGVKVLEDLRREAWRRKLPGTSLIIRCALYEYLRRIGYPSPMDILAPGDECDEVMKIRFYELHGVKRVRIG